MDGAVSGFPLDRHLANLADDGLTIVEDFLDRDTLAEARAGIVPLMGAHKGRTDFEGYLTERVYTLVARGKVFERIAEDPRMLALADRVLVRKYLLSVTQAINIHPGENAQGFHRDGGYYLLPPTFRPVCIGMIAALDDFTAENGATEMLPGSHKWSETELQTFAVARNDRTLQRDYATKLKTIEMPAGAAVIFVGTLFHQGGANKSNAPRLALTNQYCEAWLRTQEAFHLSIPLERARAMSARLQQLLGYDTFGDSMGNLTGMNPARALAPDFVAPILAEERAPRSH